MVEILFSNVYVHVLPKKETEKMDYRATLEIEGSIVKAKRQGIVSYD